MKTRPTILVEPSDYSYENAGDSAMLATALRRLRELWPSSVIKVFSNDSAALRELGLDVIPLSTVGRDAWLRKAPLSHGVYRRLPRAVRPAAYRAQRLVRRRFPGALGRARARDIDAFRANVVDADVVFTAGMGGITDAFPDYAMNLLAVIDLAVQTRAVTAMFGQGLGPLEIPELAEAARTVLPKVDLIALREDLFGHPLLRSIGVPEGRIATTGDDAIAKARERVPARLGGGLGVNMRVASYADVNGAQLRLVRDAVRRCAAELGAELVAVPIAQGGPDDDFSTIASLTGAAIGSVPRTGIDAMVSGVLEQVGRCRVVVAGSYHAGVFALAMGVPVVALFSSRYYEFKFKGLAHQFPGACRVVSLAAPAAASALHGAIRSSWEAAESGRERLLAQGACQLAAGKDAYLRLRAIVSGAGRKG